MQTVMDVTLLIYVVTDQTGLVGIKRIVRDLEKRVVWVNRVCEH